MIKIKSHFGIKDYYNYYKDNYDNPVNKSNYSKIIEEINFNIIDNMLNNNYNYKIPELGFTLNIRKDKRIPKIKNGKLYNTRPVDWKATKLLWSKDKECKEKKILVRFRNENTFNYVFRIMINKTGRNFRNKVKYKFKAARKFKRMLAARIKDNNKDKFDAYLLYKEQL